MTEEEIYYYLLAGPLAGRRVESWRHRVWLNAGQISAGRRQLGVT